MQLGCNKLALGHHRDDALETLLLNMCHQGQLKALPARYVAKRGIDVVRPLMYLAEADIGAFARAQGFPILPCNLCGSKTDGSPGQRAQMKMLLATLDSLGDGAARQNMLHALSDVRPTHLLGAVVYARLFARVMLFAYLVWGVPVLPGIAPEVALLTRNWVFGQTRNCERRAVWMQRRGSFCMSVE